MQMLYLSKCIYFYLFWMGVLLLGPYIIVWFICNIKVAPTLVKNFKAKTYQIDILQQSVAATMNFVYFLASLPNSHWTIHEAVISCVLMLDRISMYIYKYLLTIVFRNWWSNVSIAIKKCCFHLKISCTEFSFHFPKF